MNNVVDEIYSDASPRCNKLKILLLADNKGLTRIPDSFFVHMPSLRLLDITTTEMESLPNSISGLEHLTELRLEWCPYLKYVPALAKLQGLRVLILSGSAIKRIPQGLEMLVNLQYLDLYWCPSLRFQTGILSKLIRLQCLKISCGRNMNIGEEIASLTKLEILVVEFFVQHDFNNYVRSLRLQQRSLPNSFILMLGPPLHFTNISTLLLTSTQPRKFIGMAPSRNTRREDMDVLLAKDDIEEFFIGKNQNLSSLCDVLVREGGGSPSSLLPLQPCTFFGLRKLNIESNGHIKKLFTPQLKLWYRNLEEIYAKDCFNLKEIFSATKGDDEEEEKEEEMNEGSSNNDVLITITLPKLRVLKLDSLPIFNSITSRRGIMVCNSIQLITVRHCPNLKRLPLSLPMHDGQPSAPPSLTEIITDDREWWDSLEWDNSIDKDVLQSFLQFKD